MIEPTIKMVEKKLVRQWKKDGELEDNEFKGIPVRILILGVGGGGCNAINTMIEKNISGVNFAAINTDRQSLGGCSADIRVLLGKGWGAGGDPDVARDIALAEIEKINEILVDVDMLFIAGGLGGGTTTGVSPIIGKCAKEKGILTVAAITLPYKAEGKDRWNKAMNGLKLLKEQVDSFIVIPNERIRQCAPKEGRSIFDALKMPSDVWFNAISGVVELISRPGFINRDFADVKNVLKNQGLCVMGTGVGNGSNKGIDAVDKAIKDPLLADTPIENAKNILVNVVGSGKLGETEYHQIMDIIIGLVDDEGKIFPGLARDEELGENVKVTIIATGLDEVYDVARLQHTVMEDYTFPIKRERHYKLPLQINEQITRPRLSTKQILRNEGESELEPSLFPRRFDDKKKEE